ncbi:endo-1,4-beta-xylanase [Microbacterium sp. NPDC057407]|uniref:endo-1,4-beta-xylanase n=1 Tax=Microbacterium sp. NPDC057407 TaxID=3346120 RepID=UPI00366E9D8C
MEVGGRVLRARLKLVDADGEAMRRGPVVIEQIAHAFGFGNIGFDFVGLLGGEPSGPDADERVFGGADADRAAPLLPALLDVFDTVTLPFYWRGFEPVRGEPDTERLLTTARWFASHGVRVKGHPLVWHTLTPHWLDDLTDAEVEAAIRARIERDVSRFAGVIDLWDAINEAVILPVFTAEENAVTRLAQRKGRVEMVRMAFETARAANPSARLVLNDFDLSEDYERLIAECLDAGIAIDAIGLQTHMHQGYRGEEQVAGILDRFARFGLPLQLTETTLLSGDLMPPHIVDLNDYVVDSWPSTPEGEARQADEVVRHYRTVVGHPAVESLTYWGLTDDGAWLGAPAGLLRADASPKPAYLALRELIRGEWWHAPRAVETDASGLVDVHGFAGRYRATTATGVTEFDLTPGEAELTVRV